MSPFSTDSEWFETILEATLAQNFCQKTEDSVQDDVTEKSAEKERTAADRTSVQAQASSGEERTSTSPIDMDTDNSGETPTETSIAVGALDEQDTEKLLVRCFID